MAAGNTLATNITELIPEITMEADFIYQDKALGELLARVEDISGQPGTVAEYPIFTEVAGSTGVAEDGIPASHQMDLSMPTLTVARRAVNVRLTDLAEISASGNIVAQIGRAMALAKVKQDDARIFGVITATTNWSSGTGATNAALTITNVLTGLNMLKVNEVDSDLVCVLNPNQYSSIRQALTPIASDDGVSVGVASDMAREGFVSRMFGLTWYESNRIGSGTVTATTNVYNGLLFAKNEAIGYAKKFKIRGIEPERSAEGAYTKLVWNYFDATGVLRSDALVKLYSTG